MARAFVSGSWVATEDAVASVVEAWTSFLEWINAELSGLRWAMLLAEADGGRQFVSAAEWEAAPQRDSRRSHPGPRGASRPVPGTV